MRILFLGSDAPLSNSFHRAATLRRMGAEVIHVNPRRPVPRTRWAISLAVRTGFQVFRPWISRHVLKHATGRACDVVWLDCCPEVGPRLLRRLKCGATRAIGYMNDDPFGGRDGRKWDQFRAALPEYEFLAVVRDVNMPEARRAGARRVGRVFMSFEPKIHCPPTMTAEEARRWHSEVTFVGSWWPERGPFLADLIARGIPLTIHGDRWKKAPEFPQLAAAWSGREANGDDYARALAGAKVTLGLLSKGNRDLHTTRSVEVPAIGGLLCAERTEEHLRMYKEGVEAVFWSTTEECAEQCRRLIADPPRCTSIAAAGRKRVQRLGVSNDDVVAWIMRGLYMTDCESSMTLPPFA